MRILRKDLAIKLYKVQLVHKLKPIDHPSRLSIANWAEDRLAGDREFYRKNIYLDEAHFYLGGYVNKLHCRIWGTENPHVVEGNAPTTNYSLMRILL